MALRTVTYGGTTTNFSGPNTGQDLTTSYLMATNNTQLTGALDSSGVATGIRPILLTDMTFKINPTGATVNSAGTVTAQIEPNANGTHGVVSTGAWTTASVGWNGTTVYDLTTDTLVSEAPYYPWATGATAYIGIYGAGSTTINYQRGAVTGVNVYKDGTVLFADNGANSSMTWASVPGVPTNFTVTVTGTTADFTWGYPVDDGWTTSGNGANITGFRICYRSDQSSTIYSTGDIGDVFSYSISGLTSQATYTFWLAAINEVTDYHNFFSGGASLGYSYSDYQATVGVNSIRTAQILGGVARVVGSGVGLVYHKSGGVWEPVIGVYGYNGGWQPST